MTQNQDATIVLQVSSVVQEQHTVSIALLVGKAILPILSTPAAYAHPVDLKTVQSVPIARQVPIKTFQVNPFACPAFPAHIKTKQPKPAVPLVP